MLSTTSLGKTFAMIYAATSPIAGRLWLCKLNVEVRSVAQFRTAISSFDSSAKSSPVLPSHQYNPSLCHKSPDSSTDSKKFACPYRTAEIGDTIGSTRGRRRARTSCYGL